MGNWESYIKLGCVSAGVYGRSIYMPNYITLLQTLCPESCSNQRHFLTLSKSKISYSFIGQYLSTGNGKLGVISKIADYYGRGICKGCLHAKLYHSTAKTVPIILLPSESCFSVVAYKKIHCMHVPAHRGLTFCGDTL